jgi:hypothetical protein
MNPEMKKRLLEVIAKEDSALTVSDIKLLRARSSYLSESQLVRLNKLIKASGIEGLKTVAKKDLQDVSEPEVIDEVEEKVDVENVELEESPVEEGDDSLEDDADPDMPEDSGELEVIDDEVKTSSEDGDEVDIDEMNLDQLKAVAKELGIKGVHFYKDAEALREKILATYETSNEAKADADAEDTSEVV